MPAVDQVLRGAFWELEYNQWRLPSFNLKYFVSSTFTDTHNERNLIMTKLLQELNDIARPNGIDITFVDMRWGVKDENTDDHKTWDACKTELEKCRNESCESFFISLQGYKYGYRPLPREIDQIIYDNHIKKYVATDRDDLIELANKWYVLDTNSIPPKYILTKLDSNNRNDYWINVLTKLLKLLSGLMFEEDLYIGDSVTNWEAIAALNDANNNRIFWMQRDIRETITATHDPLNEFDDTRSTDRSNDIHDRLSKLKSIMMQKLGDHNRIYTTVIDSLSSIKIQNGKYDAYIAEFYDKLRNKLMSEVNQAICKKNQWFSNAFNTGLRGEVCLDLLHHYSWARDKVKDFEGREEILRQAIRVITNGDNTTISGVVGLKGVTLCVVGESGCGKTCIMAKLASLLYHRDGIPVILRFCGTNDDSSSGLKLLKSIIRQIHYLYHIVRDTIYDSYSELVAYFQSLVLTFPVILFIDSIDQLSNNNQERSKISFLDNVRPHPSTKIIVSCLPDDLTTNTWFGCDTQLKISGVSRVEVASITDEVEKILDSFLMKNSRTLTNHQREIALASMNNNSSALFIKLVARVVCSWTSHEVRGILSPSVPLLINQILNSIQYNYGKLLVQAVIAFITLAVNGVTSNEMEDLLSLDDKVMDEVNKYNKSIRLPSHVWLRVKSELAGLIVESDQGCMKWYHRQLWETAANRYGEDEKIYYHQIMGKYFGNIYDESIVTHKGINRNPLLMKGDSGTVWYKRSNKLINKRRCTEAGYHLVQGNLFVEAINELCSMNFVCAAIKTGNGFRTVKNLVKIVYGMIVTPQQQNSHERASHYMLWLRKEMNTILLNVEVNIIGTATKEPKSSYVGKDVVELLTLHDIEFCRIDKSTCHSSDDLWIRKRVLGSAETYDSCLMNLIGHTRAVENLHVSASGKLSSVSADGNIKVWDTKSGELVNAFHSHCKGVKSLCYNQSESVLFTGSYEGILHVWNSFTTECLRTIVAHSDIIRSMCYNEKTSRLFTASADRTIKVWSAIHAATNADSLEVIATLADNVLGLYSIYCNRDGTSLVSGGNDQLIKIWNLNNFQCERTFVGHYGTVMCVRYSHDESRILSAGGADFSIKLWDMRSGECIRTYVGHTHTVSFVVFNDDESRLISSGWDKTIRIWNTDTGDELNTLRAHSSWVNAVLYEHGKIFSASSDNSIKIWNYDEKRATSRRHFDYVTSLCSPPGCSIVISSGWDNTIKIWDVSTFELICSCAGHTNKVNGLCCNMHASIIVSGSDDETIRVWDIANSNGTCSLVITYTIGIRSVCITNDESRIISGSDDSLINVWSITTGYLLYSLSGHTGSIEYLIVNKLDTKIVSTGGDYLDRDNSIRIWDLGQKSCEMVIDNGHSESIYCARYSDDESMLVTCSIDKTIKLWNSSSGQLLQTYVGHDECVSSVCFSPNGIKVLLSGSKDGSIKVWDIESSSCLYTINGLASNVLGVTAVRYNNDGSKIIAAADMDVFVFESCMK